MEYLVYLVEDDEDLNIALASFLQREGWIVQSFFDGEEAKNLIKNNPHLWIIDIILPKYNGYRLINDIKREYPQLPVIIISSRDADMDRILGLELGCDDYLCKPFLPEELILRCRKLLERSYDFPQGGNTMSHKICILPPYRIDFNMRLVSANKKPIRLTAREYDLLLLFVKNPGLLLNREQIVRQVWGQDYYVIDRAVDELVYRLRKKMPDLQLETNYGYGYCLRANC